MTIAFAGEKFRWLFVCLWKEASIDQNFIVMVQIGWLSDLDKQATQLVNLYVYEDLYIIQLDHDRSMCGFLPTACSLHQVNKISKI